MLTLSETTRQLWRCPVCQSGLMMRGAALICLDMACGCEFPIVNGVPILLNESASVFSINSVYHFGAAPTSLSFRIEQIVRRFAPSNSHNPVTARNYNRFSQLLLEGRPEARVLVVGGGTLGQGMKVLLASKRIELVETDVVIGPRTQLVCDAHNLPFVDGSFDGAIVQAVLEHVVDPCRCVDELHRVLKGDGLVYAETPFMQQVHLGPYDFTRFTHLGHRRLFRGFDEVDSGPVAGPGTVLAWSYEHLLLSFTGSRIKRGLIKGFARLTGFWLKYIDVLLMNKPGALDAASGFYFLGRKSRRTLTDQELITLYRGAQMTTIRAVAAHHFARKPQSSSDDAP